ncbi:hypothetical protein D3C87_1170990 [compost metagenome]
MTTNHFARQCQIGNGASRRFVVRQRRHAVAWRFGQTDVTRNDGVVELLAEVFLELRRDIVHQAQARVVHRTQQAFDLEVRVQQFSDTLDVIHKVAQAFECEVLALHGDNDPVGGNQCVQGQHRQRRRAVDQDVIVVFPDRRQRAAQTAFLHLHFQQHHFGRGEIAVGRQQLVTTVFGEVHGLGQITFSDQQVVDRVFQAMFIHTATHGGVALWIEIDQQHPTLGRDQGCCEVDAGGGFAHATFLVRNREYLSHSCLCSQSCRAAQYQQMALALATRYGQGVFAIEVEVCRQCYQLIGRMNALHCQPACFAIAKVASPVAEVFHAAERPGNDPVERLGRLERFDATVDNLQVIQFEFEFDLSQKAGFLAVAVQTGHLRVRIQDRQRDPRHAAATADVEPATVFDERHHTQAIEQVTGNHFVRITHGGEVVSLVPFDQQGQITQQLCVLGFCQRDAKLAGTCG